MIKADTSALITIGEKRIYYVLQAQILEPSKILFFTVIPIILYVNKFILQYKH